MPVTAKLSRKFYEQLGDDVANELVEWFNAVDTTYRSELRELNDLKSDIIKWMFAVWAPTALAVVALLLRSLA